MSHIPMKRISMFIPLQLLGRLQTIAKNEGIGYSELIRRILAEQLLKHYFESSIGAVNKP